MRGQLPGAIALAVALAASAFCQDAPAATDEDNRQMVVVKAIWPGQDLEQTTFYVYADAAMKDRLHVFPADAGRGAALMMLRPGDYYLMAIVDVNANKQPDAGDGFGFYGVDNISAETQPQPLKLGEGEPHTAVIDILMVMDENGHLVPVARAPEEPGSVVGTVTGQGELAAFVLLLAAGADKLPLAAMVGDDGSFEIAAAPGKYGLHVFADADGDGRVAADDLRNERPWVEGAALVEVAARERTDLGEIELAVVEGVIEGLPPVLAGRVTGADLATAAQVTVSLYSDEGMKSLVMTAPVGADGGFCVALRAGTYYAKVTADLEGDGRLTAGDMLGFFGVTDIMSGERPQPLVLGNNALRTDVLIPLTAQLDDEGKLVAIKAADNAADVAE